MPSKLPTPCGYPGCPGISVKYGRCAKHLPEYERKVEEHRRESRQEYDKTRETPKERGYDEDWARLRKWYLARNPLCERCGQPAEIVHHRRVLADGGERLDANNLEALCGRCHRRHHASTRWRRKGQASMPVTVVCGPPGSGKTTWVQARTQRGDLIVDADKLFEALSGLPPYDKPECLLPFVADAREAIYNRLCRQSNLRHAWIIASGAKAKERSKLRERFSADVIVLEVSPEECLRRIGADERRRQNMAAWGPIVARWWDKYERDVRDIVFKG